MPRCIVGSWSQLEEQFYEYFGKTNKKRPITVESSAKRGLLRGMKERIDSDVSKGSATKAKQHNILSESITYQETSLATEKHEKHKKIARLDFFRDKGVVHLSSDYRIIDGDQAPTSNKGGMPASSELAKLTSKSSKLIAACPESARPTASAAFPESARPTSQLGKPTAPASAQVDLADFQSASRSRQLPMHLRMIRYLLLIILWR